MGEPYMTMAEIEKAYPNEWVLIDKPKRTKTYDVLGGHVIYHGPDKLALYKLVDQLPRPFDIAVFYLGPISEGDAM